MKRGLKIGYKKISLDYLVIAIMLIIPFFNLWYFNVYKSKIFYILVFFICLLSLKLSRFIETNIFPKIAIPLFGYLCVSMFFLNFSASFEYLLVVMFGLLISTIKFSEETLNRLTNIIVIIGLFFAITMIWHWASPGTFYPILKRFVSSTQYQQAIDYTYAGDYTGFACESHCACLCIAPAACIIASRLFFKKTRTGKNAKYVLMFLIMFFAMYLSGRRAFIIFFPTVVVSYIIYFLFRKGKSWSVLLGIFILFAILLALYLWGYQFVIGLLTGGSGDTIQLSKRERYWDLALRMFYERPLTGMGMRSYDTQYDLMSGRGLIFAGAHNCYLQFLAETGIIGLVLFIIFIISMIFKTLKTTIFCIHNRKDFFGSISMASLFMQCIYVIVAMSESVYIAPYSLTLYFVLLCLAENARYMVNEKE